MFERVWAFGAAYPWIAHLAKVLGVLALSWVVYFLTKRYLLRWLAVIVRRSKSRLDDMLLRSRVFHRLALIPPAIIIYSFAPLAGGWETLVRRVMTAVLVFVSLLVLDAALTALNEVYSTLRVAKKISVRSYIQITKIALYLFGVILVIAVLIGQSPLVLVSGFGALTAVLLLIFRDTILSFVASLEISSYDLIKEGDWIEVPLFGADGTVIDIALHAVKVQNWDKTITVIPTHKLIEGSFKNWRGMTMSGGRRIKRAIYIDISTIKFCDEEMTACFEKVHLIADYVRSRRAEIEEYNRAKGVNADVPVNGRRMTNVGTFRAYVKAYLSNHPKIHPDLTFLVRQLAPGPQGLPIEIYVFSRDTEWVNYEEIQADIFDHLLAAATFFELGVFQYPAGKDLHPDRGEVVLPGTEAGSRQGER